MRFLPLLVPIIGAATGWLTFELALKLLFWPREPWKMPWGITVRGVIPQKRQEIVTGLRETIEGYIRCAVSGSQGVAPEILEKVTDAMVITARERVNRKIPGLVPGAVRQKIAGIVEDIIRREVPEFVAALGENLQGGRDCQEDLLHWLEERADQFDLQALETKVRHSREAVFLKAGAAVIGFAAGCLQLLVMVLADY